MERVYKLLSITFLTLGIFSTVASAWPTIAEATFDPTALPNNRYGIHIIEPTELPLASKLVNSSGGDWGYVVVVIRSDDRDIRKWQDFFDTCRRQHLIPIVRIATKVKDDYWQRPEQTDATDWANFFKQLRWPINNHYIVVYNEPNHAKEWGNNVDPQGYAQELYKTIDAIKAVDPDAFLLNAGFDAAAPTSGDQYMEEQQFLSEMEKAVPGIFRKLDGWASHSYPQPFTTGNVNDRGRNTITTYRWEIELLQKNFGTSKLPVFITETGWEAKSPSDLNEQTIAKNFEIAYKDVWTDDNLVAIGPFTLHYEDKPFNGFSWIKKVDAANKPAISLGGDKYATLAYDMVQQLPKKAGQPVQKDKITITKLLAPKSVIPDSTVKGIMRIENTGESIWQNNFPYQMVINTRGEDHMISLNPKLPLEPGREVIVPFSFKAPSDAGVYNDIIIAKQNNEEAFRQPVSYQILPKPSAQPNDSNRPSFWQNLKDKIRSIFS